MPRFGHSTNESALGQIPLPQGIHHHSFKKFVVLTQCVCHASGVDRIHMASSISPLLSESSSPNWTETPILRLLSATFYSPSSFTAFRSARVRVIFLPLRRLTPRQ